MHIITSKYQFESWIILYKQLRMGSFQRWTDPGYIWYTNKMILYDCSPAKESFPSVKRLSTENNCVTEKVCGDYILF